MKNPIKKFINDGGYSSIFRRIGCVGDSLSSGEFETIINGEKGWHDLYDYSWGQFISRTTGAKVYNFSRGGMSCKWFLESYAKENGFLDKNKACQAYIIALGENDIIGQNQDVGCVGDIDFNDYSKNKPTFAGLYANIIQIYKEIEPNAKFFLMTIPKRGLKEMDERASKVAQLLYEFSKVFSNTYVLDLYKYAPVYNDEFKKKYFLNGHMNPMGYVYTAKMVMTYIDNIIKNNMSEFDQVGLIGTEWYLKDYKK